MMIYYLYFRIQRIKFQAQKQQSHYEPWGSGLPLSIEYNQNFYCKVIKILADWLKTNNKTPESLEDNIEQCYLAVNNKIYARNHSKQYAVLKKFIKRWSYIIVPDIKSITLNITN